MSSTFSLNGRIGLNVSDLVSNAEKARKAVSDIGDELDDVDGKKTEPLVTVDDKASPDIGDVRANLADLDGETATPTVSVDDKASGELGVIGREVSGLDGETAAPTVKIDDKASGALDDIEKQLSKDLPDAANAGGKKASGNLAGSFDDLAGAGGKLLGGAVAGAIVAGLNQGMERIQVREQITQQFGLIEEDAMRLGAQAADIYAGGWGEGTMEVLASLAQVNQRLVQTGAVGVEETARIGESAIVLAKVFGMDVAEVIEAVGKLMLNGLAPDAQTAMDLLGAAMQQGAGAAGDLFESVDEFAQHFADFGLSAEDMMALFVHGMQNGQRDTDKLADAVKEMRIRTVDSVDGISAAYADLGLDADAYRAKILAGGPSAKQAFGEIITALRGVEDPVEQNRLAVELMGTQIEDLGISSLESFAAMSDGVDDFTGTVDEMNASMTDAQPNIERLWRTFKEDAGSAAEDVAGVVEKILGLTASTEDLEQAEQDLFDKRMKQGREEPDRAGFVAAIERVIAASEVEADVSVELRAHYTKLGQKIELTTTLQELAADASVKTAEALEEERKQAEDLANQIDALTDAHMGLIGSQMDVEEAIWDAEDAAVAFNDAIADGEMTGREYERALNDVTREQLNAASATADYLIAILEKDGVELSSTEKTRIHTEALKGLADTLSGPLREELDKHIAELEAIPGDVETAVGFELGDTDANLLLLQGMLDTTGEHATEMGEEFGVVAESVETELGKVGPAGIRAIEKGIEDMMIEAENSAGIGVAIGDGVVEGILESQERAYWAASSLVRSALAGAKDEAFIYSPSRLFAEEVGQPISQGVAEGIEEDAFKVTDALTDTIKEAQESAVAAAHDLADAVLDEFARIADEAGNVLAGLFGDINTADRIEGLEESVSDKQNALAEAQQNLMDVQMDAESTAKDLADAQERVSDAEESLRDANMLLTEATIANSQGTDEQKLAWENAAVGAGLTAIQIRDLAEAYKELLLAQKDLDIAKANDDWVRDGAVDAVNDEAAAANALNDRFKEAIGAGIVLDSDFKALANLAGLPQKQLEMQQQILDRIAKFFAGVQGFANGGRPRDGMPVMVGENGPELVTFGRNALVHTATQTAAMFANGAQTAAMAGIGASGPVTINTFNSGTGDAVAGAVNVSVQIGQTELRDMITDVVISHERQKELVR